MSACAACGKHPAKSEKVPFCPSCWNVCPEQTREAFRNGAAIRRVIDAINLRQASAKDVSAARFTKIDYRH